MRICFYGTIRDWPWGAPDYVWPHAARKFLEQGDKVLVCAPEIHQNRIELVELRSTGATIHQIPNYTYQQGKLMKVRRFLSGENREVRKLRKVLREFQPDLVFLNQGGTACALCESDLMDFLKATHTPYVLFCHLNQRGGVFSKQYRDKIVSLYNSAYKVLFNSPWMLDLTQKQVMMNLQNVGFFFYVVRFDWENPLQMPESGVPRLASVSRLDSHHKGLDVLLEAVAMLKKDDLVFRLELAGDGPDREYLEKLSEFLEVSDMVFFTGRSEDVREIWERNELLVLVSRFEGLAVSMLEAMACGRPVLRTPYGGSDWIEHGKNGFICPAAEPELIADSIRDALSHREDWQRMGIEAHAILTKRLPKNPEKIYLDIADELRS